MKQEFDKYYLRYAWFPKTLDSGEMIWFRNYYEVHFDLPFIDPVYTISRISTIDYIVECLKGTIVDGYCTNWGFNVISERMLNAVKLLPTTEQEHNAEF